MEPRQSSEPSNNSTESGARSRSDVDESPLPQSFVSIDSFLDSVSIGGATVGSPSPAMQPKLRAVEPLDLLIDDDGSADDVPMSAQPEPEPEPEPQPEPEPEPEPEPDHGPQTQSREAALARAQPPGSVLSSSSDGSDDSSDRPEPGGAVFDVVQEGKAFCLSVGAMGIQLFRHKKIIVSYLYDDMIGGWSFDVGDGPLSPSRTRAVGVVRICLEHFGSEQIKEMKLSGAWMSGTPTLKVFGVMSQRVGKYITMQMDMRFSKMVRDREESQLASDGGEPQVCGDLGRGFDDADGDPSLQYVAYEQHRCGLLMRFLQDSQTVVETGPALQPVEPAGGGTNSSAGELFETFV